ncbi:MAG: hypothetical protein C4562_03240 [Actinobacteria bacterium]|nr:MAG: hypothetical protein C4562_03240 [Actinomycetota bacterium]
MDKLLEDGVTTFLAVWLLIHEVADDVINDVILQAENKPLDKRDELEKLIVKVASQKSEIRKYAEGLIHEPKTKC